jgi:hypothetical protein
MQIYFGSRNTRLNERPREESDKGRSNEMQEERRDQYIGGGRLTHLLLPAFDDGELRSQQATAALTARPPAVALDAVELALETSIKQQFGGRPVLG